MTDSAPEQLVMRSHETGPPRAPARSLSDFMYDLRDRLLTSPGMQRWLSRFPLTRGFARRKERELFAIVTGFVSTQVLTAGCRLGLFNLLRAEGPLGIGDIATRLKLEREPAARLVDAAVSLGLLSLRSGERFGLGDLGTVIATTPAFNDIVAHNAIFYRDIADPVRILQGDLSDAVLARFWAYAHDANPANLTPEAVADYTRFMAASQALIAEETLNSYPLARHTALLDVGGGDGTFLVAAGRRYPHLALSLFDLPAVCDVAREKIHAAGMAARTRIAPGSFHTDALPSGCDLAVLNRVLLDHDDATVLALLRAVRAALPPGGHLLVAETLAGQPAGDAYFGFYLMTMGRGRPRSYAAMRELLVAAAYTDVRQVPTARATLTNLVLAVRPR